MSLTHCRQYLLPRQLFFIGVEIMRELKFIHCADITDAPFKETERKLCGDKARGYKHLFLKPNRVKDTNSDFSLISGDLYEHHFITRKTMDWLTVFFPQVKVPPIIIPEP